MAVDEEVVRDGEQPRVAPAAQLRPRQDARVCAPWRASGARARGGAGWGGGGADRACRGREEEEEEGPREGEGPECWDRRGESGGQFRAGEREVERGGDCDEEEGGGHCFVPGGRRLV